MPWNRIYRHALVLGAYVVLLASSVWLAYQLRFDFFVSGEGREMVFLREIPSVVAWVLPVKLAVLLFFRQFSGLLSYFGTPDLYRVMRAVLTSSAIVGLVRIQFPEMPVPPRGVILIDFILSSVFLAGFRIGCRAIRENWTPVGVPGQSSAAYRIAIIGAGDVGASLAKELLRKRGLGRTPVAFFDDDRGKLNQRIHDIPVVGAIAALPDSRDRLAIEEVIIAIPNAPAKRIAEIVRMLQSRHIKFVTVPSLDQMATGKVRVSQIRQVEIEDLLRREPIELNIAEIQDMVTGRVILVTGAGGSIGRELCRQIVSLNPEKLLMVDQSEFLLFEIEQELLERGFAGIVVPLVGSILDEKRMREIVATFAPKIVFHAAALKHVPMLESQPQEAVKVNVLGTVRVARIAGEMNVERFVMISTDKAINPTSVMGATKRFAEMYIQSLNKSQEFPTNYMAVRFGNVLGSSGSVIPTFKRQILNGGPVKVTHADVTRYFMTIPEAVGLVLQCGSQGKGGEIFVLDMGEPVKIVDLARNLIELSGLRPDEDIEIEFVGLRPGEKLYEELQHSGENFLETNHNKILCFVCEGHELVELEEIRKNFEAKVSIVEGGEIKKMLQKAVVEYKPYLQ